MDLFLISNILENPHLILWPGPWEGKGIFPLWCYALSISLQRHFSLLQPVAPHSPFQEYREKGETFSAFSSAYSYACGGRQVFGPLSITPWTLKDHRLQFENHWEIGSSLRMSLCTICSISAPICVSYRRSPDRPDDTFRCIKIKPAKSLPAFFLVETELNR